MQISIVTNFARSGVGKHGACFFEAMKNVAGFNHKIRRVVPADGRSMEMLFHRRMVSKSALVVVVPDLTQDWSSLRYAEGRKVAWCVFESDFIPKSWCANLEAFDELWVPSEWGREVLLSAGISQDRLFVLSEGVDTKMYRHQPQAHQGFRFLSVGKYEPRKAIDETIGAFRAAFPDVNTNVELWLKADHPSIPARVDSLMEKVSGDKRIRVIKGYLDEPGMAQLYNQVDAFVFASKAEGFGLPGLEAISSGLPIIATNYSGQSQYLSQVPDKYLDVKFRLENFRDADYFAAYRGSYESDFVGRWAEPDHESMVSAMREIFGQPEKWRARALEAAAILRSRLDWKQIAATAIERLDR